MPRTIKDQIHNQIVISQHLLSFQDSDSSKSDEQQKSENMALKIITNKLQDQNTFYSHQQMIKKRRQVLRQLSISPTNKTNKTSNDKVQSLKSHPQKRSSQSDCNMIVDLKSKLAQVLKESQEKSNKVKQLQSSLSSVTCNLQKLRQTLNQKENQINLKEKQNSKLQYQNFKLKEEYHKRIKELQQQLNTASQIKKTQFSCKSAISKGQNNALNQLKIQVELKNQQIKELRKNEEKGKRIIGQNKKLKKDVERLLLLVEKCAQKQTFSKSKHKKTEEKLNTKESSKKRSISLGQQNSIVNKYNKTDCYSIKCSESTKNQQFEKSITSINDKKPLSQSSTCLINEVQKFLRKWHVAQNNQKFVQSLVDLIHQFTQQCIDQHKVKIQSNYRSLKKQMLRKANQSLNFQQIMKERQFKIKQNTTLNDQNQKLKVLKTQPQFNAKDRTLSSDNLSILVPASNKKQYDYKNSKLLSVSLLDDKSIRKEDISYNNLQQSIRLHKKMSNYQIVQKLNQNDKIEEKIDSFFTQLNARKPHRKTKTQISNFSKKHNKNLSDKKQTKSLYKNSGLTIKNLKII